MQKLTTAQWVAFVFLVAGIVIGQLEIAGVPTATLGIISSSIASLKLIWDAYNSFGAQDVADFANDIGANNTSKSKNSSASCSKRDVKEWAKK
tara:strand:+ start:708 stop:986 length:279 start_codon:yes stop_codon:yes gene_type:complete